MAEDREDLTRPAVRPDPHAGEVATSQEMRDEAGSGGVAPPVGVMTKSQAQGAMGGVLIGAVIGAIVGLIVGLIAGGGGILLITLIAFAVAGAVAGFVAGGATKPMRGVDHGEADT